MSVALQFGFSRVLVEGPVGVVRTLAQDLLVAIDGSKAVAIRTPKKQREPRGGNPRPAKLTNPNAEKYRALMAELDVPRPHGYAAQACAREGVKYYNFAAWRARERDKADAAKINCAQEAAK